MFSQDCNKMMEFTNMFLLSIQGVSEFGSRIHIAYCLPLEEKMNKRRNGCRGSSLTIGGRTILINPVLRSMSTYDTNIPFSLNKLKENGYNQEKIFLVRMEKEDEVLPR